MDFLSIFALVLLLGMGIVLAYGLIIIHDIPYKIAKSRNHPHAEAIECAGWVSLFLMHAIWPFLWIWAMLYRPGEGFGAGRAGTDSTDGGESAIIQLTGRLEALEAKFDLWQSGSGDPPR